MALDHDEDDVDDDGDGKGMVGNDRVGCLWTHTSPASRALSRPRICIYSTPISWNAQKFDAASFSTKLGQSGMADQFAISTSDYLDSSCTASLVMVMATKIWLGDGQIENDQGSCDVRNSMYDDDEGDEWLRKRRMMMILVQMKNLIYGLPRWVRRTCETATCPRQPQSTTNSAQPTVHFVLWVLQKPQCKVWCK